MRNIDDAEEIGYHDAEGDILTLKEVCDTTWRFNPYPVILVFLLIMQA
jgi:hypothetical protein